MAKTKNKSPAEAQKYKRHRELANARNRKYKENMSDEKLEEKRKRDRERYHRLKQEKKIKLVSDMSEKEKKACRKVWRKRKATLRKKQKERNEILSNTPPNSDAEQLTGSGSRQKEMGRKKVRKDRSKAYRDLKKQKDENKKLKMKLEKYKKRLQREIIKNKTSTPSPSKKVRKLVGSEKISPQIKKRLFVGYALEKQLKSTIASCKPKTKERQIIAKSIGTKILRKYRVQTELTQILPYTLNKRMVDGDVKYMRKKYTTVKVKEALAIKKFFLNDQISRMMPGKKDFVKKGKHKMQRRVLLNSLDHIYKDFKMKTNINVSYSTFTRCRPFWVQKPTKKDRETCACAKHENMEFLVSALHSAKSIVFENAHAVLEASVCSTSNEKCMLGQCLNCLANEIYFDEDVQKIITFHQWVNVNEKKCIKGKERIIRKVLKFRKEADISEVKKIFQEQLATFKKHVFAMKHQGSKLNFLTEHLKEDELLFQIDFSQNYMAKCSSEIQSMHFGASKPQISLHTGVIHFVKHKKTKCKSFCTMSDNLDHMSYAVWAHLNPILLKAASDFPDTRRVYFFSDSPSSQYRNKNNAYFMGEILPKIFPKLKYFSWNFSEPGHGKGCMDGVGGSIKRNADQRVLHGHDIMCSKDLVEAFKTSSTYVEEIPSHEIEHFKTLLPACLLPINGIMNIRQIFWDGTVLHGRRLTCLECLKICSHYHSIIISSLLPNHQVTEKKFKLRVADVYSSDDESEKPKLDVIKFNPNYEFHDLKPETFIIVTFETGKKTQNFLAVIQGEISDDREVEVLFLKKTKDQKIFQPDDNDVAWIGCDQILGTLPTPQMFFQGERLFYKFDNVVMF